jgi:hypothetical protein
MAECANEYRANVSGAARIGPSNMEDFCLRRKESQRNGELRRCAEAQDFPGPGPSALPPQGTVSPQTTNVPGPRSMSRDTTQQSLGERGTLPFNRPIPDPPGVAAAPLDLLCWQITGKRTGQRTPEFPSAFSNASALLVEVDDALREASPATKHLLAQNIAKALALWRLACVGCGPYNVAVLRLDSEIYMDSDLAGYFERCTFTGKVRTGSPYSRPSLDGPMACEDAEVLLSSRVGGRGVSKAYRQMTLTQTAAAQLCQQPSS